MILIKYLKLVLKYGIYILAPNIYYTNLVSGFEKWYISFCTQFTLNVVPVPVLVFKQYP